MKNVLRHVIEANLIIFYGFQMISNQIFHLVCLFDAQRLYRLRGVPYYKTESL